MALKKTITAEEHTGLDTAIQSLYTPSADGFTLDVDGGFEDVTGLKSALDKERRVAREALARIKKFDGFDPDEYQTLKSDREKAEQERLKKEGDFDGIKKQILDAAAKEKAELQAALEGKDGTIYNLMVSSQFAKSPLIAEKTLLPPDIAETYFGKNFKVETVNGTVRVVGYLNGQIIADGKTGEPANFEQALAVILEAYPNKDKIFKSGSAGSGSPGGGGMPQATGAITKLSDLKNQEAKAEFIGKYGLETFKKLAA